MLAIMAQIARGTWPHARRALGAILLLALAGCQFKSSITPIGWATVPPQPFQQATLGPQMSPIPLAPTPSPPPPVFEGIDSLDCAQPKKGDNHYGYCRIPGTQEFYAWGECVAECPEGPYPGIQIITVSEADSTLFRAVIDGRNTSLAERGKGFGRGGVLGFLGVGLGVPGVIKACIAMGSWNMGKGCLVVLGVVAVDAVIAVLDVKDGTDAHSELTERNGYEDSAQDLFQQLLGLEGAGSSSPP